MSERLILPIEARLNLSRLRRPRVRVSAWEATYAHRLLERLN